MDRGRIRPPQARGESGPPLWCGPPSRLFHENRMKNDSTPECCGGGARGERNPLLRGLLLKVGVPLGLFALLALLGVLLR